MVSRAVNQGSQKSHSKKLSTFVLIFLLLAQSASFASTADIYYSGMTVSDIYFEASNKFPTNPDPQMTPGKLCTKPSSHRYAENIAYCERDVSSGKKNQIIAAYDSELGFQIRQMNRGDFKIDHFIPLSIGGSNDVENLWPQHKSVYAYSDIIESELSNLMVDGKIKQKEAITVIKECKLNLSRCADLQKYLKSLH